MKKSFRILALVMALMTALGAASFASAEVVKDYVGTTTMVESDFFYQGPGTSYAFVQGQSRVEKGTRVILFGITSDGKWSYIGFDIHMGYVQTSCLDDAITLKNGNTDSIKAMLARGSSASSGNVTVGPIGSTTATTNATGVIYNCTNWVSLRAEASSSSKRIAKLTPNTTVTVTGEQNGYYKVTAGNYIGYVLKSYVRVTSSGSTTGGTTGGTTSGGKVYVPGVGWVDAPNSSTGTTGSGSSSVGWTGGNTSGGYTGNWTSGWGNLSGSNNNNNNNNNSGNVTSNKSIGTAVTTGTINFRQGPGTNYSKVTGCAQVPKGATVTLLEYTSSDNGWYKVIYGSYTGYLSAKYLKVSLTNNNAGSNNNNSGNTSGSSWNTGWNTGNNNSGSSATATTGTTTGNVNFRQGPGTGYSKVSGCAKVPKGSTVTILEQTNGWYKVTYKSYTGYLSADYVAVAGSGVNTPGSTGNNVSGSGVGTQYAKYTGTSADIWGSMSVAGTNISDNIYCNAMNSKGQFVYNAYSSSKNNLYALSYLTDPIAVIYGHNMRKVAKKQTTNLGLHELHHVQNAWLGKAKCEYCGRSCSGAKTSTFNISYNGSSSWTLVGFFELSNSTMSSAAQRKKIQTYASFNSTLTGSAKQQWVDTMMSYCNSKYLGATLGSISGSDKVMVIITCADKSGSKNQSMYMILKGN
ncbi:MAG: SH3 domain-containing protein [Christensenellaceae bacterium]|nr:SH3 domain-containing protein [Christensenellaceae bacterium]